MKTIFKYLLLSIFCMHAQASEVAKELPVEAFFKKPSVDGLRISPDGKYFAARAAVNGNKNIVILDAKTNKPVAIFDFGDGQKEVGTFGWLNKERIYASMVKKMGPLEKPYASGYLFAGNVTGKKKAQLLPRPARPGKPGDSAKRYSILDTLGDDPEHILVQLGTGASRQKVIKLNVYTGRQKLAAKSPFLRNSFGVDHNAKIRFLTSRDDSYKIKTVYYRDTEEQDWVKIDERNIEKSSYQFITFTPDNKKFYYYESDENNKAAVYLFDPQTKTSVLIHTLSGDQDIESYVFDEPTEQLIGVVREKGKLVKEYFDDTLDISAKHLALDKAFPGQFVRILNHTEDFSKALLVSQSDKNPGSFYLFDKSKGDVKYLMKIYDRISAKNMGERRPVSFMTRDDLEIRGIITFPKGKTKDLPLIVLVHGGPYGIKDDWLYHPEAQYLANRGYAVFQVNYRGSGGRGKSFQYDNYQKVGMEMQDDLTDATLWAIKEGIADKERVCIYGGSYGGYASLMGVVKEPDLYKCAIGYAGVYDITVQAEKSDTRFWESGKKFLEDAWNAYDEDFVKERSAAFHVDKIKAALFLVHGGKDKRTPIENYETLTEALDEINYPYESLVKDFEGHGFFDEENRIEFYKKMVVFFDKHIGK